MHRNWRGIEVNVTHVNHMFVDNLVSFASQKSLLRCRLTKSEMAFAKSRLLCVLTWFLIVVVIYQSTAETVLVETEYVSDGSRMQRDLSSGDGKEKSQVTPMNVAFDLPDLTVSVETTTGTAQLEAYKSVSNDKILQDSFEAKISQLFWVTVGLPTFIKTPNPQNSNDVKLFHFNNRGFSIYLEMKTDAMGSKLAEAARNKYKVNISDNQVVHLILSKFDCSTILYDAADNKYVLKGRVADFRKFPLRMDFKAPLKSQERRLFEEEFREHEGDLEFDCNMASSGGKVIKTNTLTISANQLQQIGLEEKLFGPAGNNGKTDVYVSRDQMSELASEMYSTLNIVEDYEMPEFQFKDAFVDGIISQISTIGFDLVPIDTVLASISKYGFDVGADIQPDVIKKDIGSILKIETTDSKSHIVLTDESERESSNSKSNNGEVGIKVLDKLDLTTKWGTENKQTSSSKDKSLSDQLHELNEATKNEAQWQIEGDRVVPKSLNVAHLTRAKMSKTLTFNRIRMQTFEAPFHRSFSLYTLTASASASFLDQLSSRVAHLEETTKQISTNADTRIGNLNAAIQSVQSTAVRRCRVCLLEFPSNMGLCVQTSNSCSGWSDTGGYGYVGCRYQYRVECLSY